MALEELYEAYKKLRVPSLSEIRDAASEHSKTSLVIIILLVLLLLMALQYIPHYQVSQFNITNQKDLADAENSYRATLAQIFGGIAIAIGLYYTWRRIFIAEEDLKVTQDNLKVAQDNLKVTQKIAQDNLKVAQEGQITERFTRAIEQLGAKDKDGNPAIEIRLGGIYALERIANESESECWPIMEILAAYIRKNSSAEIIENKKIITRPIDIQDRKFMADDALETMKVSLDIQTALTVIGRRKYSFDNSGPATLNLQEVYLCGANLRLVSFEWADLQGAHLEWADLQGAHLERTDLIGANLLVASLEGAILKEANLERVNFEEASLEEADLGGAYLKWANIKWANLKRANLKEANLTEAKLERADLRGAKNLTVDQLSVVKTLYKAELDPELEAELRAKGFGHLLDNEPE